jgi:hypothetical protein
MCRPEKIGAEEVSMSVCNLSALRDAEVKSSPYPYLVLKNFVNHEALAKVISDFPKLDQGGSFALEKTDYGPAMQPIIDTFHSLEMRQIIEKKFDIDLCDRPVMITARGFSRAKDGRIHTDSKSKLVTLLLYLNENWNEATGNLRILNQGQSLEDYSEEVSSEGGTLLAFKVTDNCWHGYPSFEGKRQSLQINYVVNDAAANKHKVRHKIAAKFKSLFVTGKMFGAGK